MPRVSASRAGFSPPVDLSSRRVSTGILYAWTGVSGRKMLIRGASRPFLSFFAIPQHIEHSAYSVRRTHTNDTTHTAQHIPHIVHAQTA